MFIVAQLVVESAPQKEGRGMEDAISSSETTSPRVAVVVAVLLTSPVCAAAVVERR
jgi:hypothetical protein